MTTRRNAAGRLQEEISNAGVPPHGDQVPFIEKDINVDQAPVNPSPLIDDIIRANLFKMAQAITTQAQSATIQAQAMMAKANREVVP